MEEATEDDIKMVMAEIGQTQFALKIRRIINDRHAQRYQQFKKELKEDCPDAKGQLLENYGFHGTRPQNVGNILQHNFDERLTKKGYMGRAIYFAKEFTKAWKFASCTKCVGKYKCDLPGIGSNLYTVIFYI